MSKSFYLWLLQFESDNTPLGDLAKDVKLDKNFPCHATSYKYIKKYLVNKSACKDALNVFEDAFCQYNKLYKNT